MNNNLKLENEVAALKDEIAGLKSFIKTELLQELKDLVNQKNLTAPYNNAFNNIHDANDSIEPNIDNAPSIPLSEVVEDKENNLLCKLRSFSADRYFTVNATRYRIFHSKERPSPADRKMQLNEWVEKNILAHDRNKYIFKNSMLLLF